MEKPSPGIRRALYQARLYGYLVARNDRLYRPGGSRPVCGVQMAKEMVKAGWLRRSEGRYEITPEGLRTSNDNEYGV
jgi:hypothetical protein